MADASKSVKRVGKYEIGKTLGEGTFGKVKYAVNTTTGVKVRVATPLSSPPPPARRDLARRLAARCRLSALHAGISHTHTDPSRQVAIKILDKEKIQHQNMGNQIKKEVRR